MKFVSQLVIQHKDKNKKITSYKYDNSGRKIKTTFPDKSEEKITYLGKSKKVLYKTHKGGVTHYKYNGYGKISSVSRYPEEALKKAKTEKEKQKLFDKNIIRKYKYDLFGELVDTEHVSRTYAKKAIEKNKKD